MHAASPRRFLISRRTGDSVLKFLASTSLFVLNPNAPESDMHLARQNIISNRALLQAARRVGLPPFILMKPLSLKSWMPPKHDFEPEKPKELSEEDAQDAAKVAAAKAAKGAFRLGVAREARR